jgi:cephalosporin hydroxylase/glycosyltransferase involved in cell wall biosynthesis
MISVIIPAKNEVYLQKTIDNVLENAEGDIEIIAICDGYWPDPPIKDHPSVRIIHNTVSRGQRHSINDAARLAQGDIIGKLDAHCAVGPGFNTIIERDMEDQMIMVPEMWNLDIETWAPRHFDDYAKAMRNGKVNPYMYIGLVDGNLRAQYYNGGNDRKRMLGKQDIKIDDTMCCMGPGWFLKKDFYWEIGGCDEAHGHWGQQGVEMACKAWLSGGRMVVNKNTWFAHWFRGSYEHPDGRKGFPYPISQREVDAARRYSNDLWRGDKWPKAVHTFQWLVDKFDPPGWGEVAEAVAPETHLLGISPERLNLFQPIYAHIHGRKHDSSWKGLQLLKFPTDMILYHEVIWETRPDLIIEIGTKFGASAVFFQDMMEMYSLLGQVVTVDIKDQVAERDPRIQYFIGDSLDDALITKLYALADGRKTMLVIDGNHNRRHVKWELSKYANIVTPGQYMVVEDCFAEKELFGPGEALQWFLPRTDKFEQIDQCDRYLISMTMGGWLKRK